LKTFDNSLENGEGIFHIRTYDIWSKK